MIRYCLEKLYHFSCDECGKWFSVGDWTRAKKMTCPHCGIEQGVEKK
jgi:DNA-directed RNA polymerase subunit RPC12/RpoP